MTDSARPGASVCIKLLHEAEGHTVIVELKNGEVYRGRLVEAEDNMNCQLQDLTKTARDGKETKLQEVYIRGSRVRFMVFPNALRYAPFFKDREGKPPMPVKPAAAPVRGGDRNLSGVAGQSHRRQMN